jgi:hypothetical protein
VALLTLVNLGMRCFQVPTVVLVFAYKDVTAGLYMAFERCMDLDRGMGDQLAIRIEPHATDKAIPKSGP